MLGKINLQCIIHCSQRHICFSYLGFYTRFQAARQSKKISLSGFICFFVISWGRLQHDTEKSEMQIHLVGFSQVQQLFIVLKWMNLSIPSHHHCKDKMVWASLGASSSPKEVPPRFLYPDKNKGWTKRPQSLAIVLMVHAYSPTVIADGNHRMFLVISFPRMWKRTRDWLYINPPFVRLDTFFCQTSCSLYVGLLHVPAINHLTPTITLA